MLAEGDSEQNTPKRFIGEVLTVQGFREEKFFRIPPLLGQYLWIDRGRG